jgi:hypothetical protein
MRALLGYIRRNDAGELYLESHLFRAHDGSAACPARTEAVLGLVAGRLVVVDVAQKIELDRLLTAATS